MDGEGKGGEHVEVTIPHVSVIVSCSVIRDQVRSFLDHIAETQPVTKIELILVAWKGYDYRELVTAPFASIRQVFFDPGSPLGEARARAVEIATAEVVVFLEDHVRFEGRWVDSLVSLFEREKCGVAGWTVKPGPVSTTIVWTGYLAEYGRWGPGVQPGVTVDDVPGHDCAYRRDCLIRQGEALGDLLRAERLLHRQLLEQGEMIYFTTDFAMRHFQFQSVSRLLRINFWYGWNYADVRQTVRQWGFLWRLVFAMAILLKPIARWRILLAARLDKSFAPAGLIWRCSPGITLTFLVASIGESLGHLIGRWRAPLILSWYELSFDRTRL